MLKLSRPKHLMLAGVTALAFAAPAHAQLDSALSAAKASTAASEASQRRVEQLDDEADQMIREYRAVLQQKDNVGLYVAQREIYLQSQEAEIASLNRQLGTVEQIKQGMIPMMLRMTAEIEDSIRSDVPFLLDERLARVERVKQVLSDPAVSPAEQYRQVLNAFKVEVSYGQGLDSYEGAHPTRPGNVVNFVRFGRVAFVYMTKDESEIARYNMDTGEWDRLTGNKAIDMRQAIRIANGEAAPRVVTAPVMK
ncbi:MAG: DUF3450 domain-containing protein [Hyphomonadaceae bacterium]|nr:DUF3450 domain-containing protein [Hyphomonadaceae bacterium]